MTPSAPDVTPINTEIIEVEAQCEPENMALCIRPEDIDGTIKPQITSNQIKISLLVYLGAIIGAILYLLLNYIMRSGQLKRDELRTERQNRMEASNKKLEAIHQSYKATIDMMAEIFQKIVMGKNLGTNDIVNYKKATVPLEIFGSEESQNAHRKFLSMISQKKVPTEAEYTVAKVEFNNALKKDLGLA